MRTKTLFLLLPVVLLFAAGCAESGRGKARAFRPDAALASAMDDFRVGRAMDDAAKTILESDMPAMALFDYLKGAREFPEQDPGWRVGEVAFKDGYSLKYAWRVPIDYDPAAPHPVLFVLHGGVSTPTPYPIERLEEYGDGFAEVFSATDASAFVVVPQGSGKAPWWSERGMRMVTEPLNFLKRRYNIDTNRVFVTGFSDGASGCWFLASVNPTPFAAFFPFNGIIAVGARYHPLFISNLTNRPIFACNTTEDSLYPPQAVEPFIEAMKKSGAPIEFRMFSGIGHAFGYGEEITEDVSRMIRETRRNPWRNSLRYTVLAMDAARCDWAEVLERGNNRNPAEFYEPVVVVPSPMRLGITIDRKYEGEGVLVQSVAEGGNAGRIGIRPGDVILSYSGESVADLRSLAAMIAATKPDTAVEIKVKRKDKEIVLKGVMRVPPPGRYLSYDEEPSAISITKDGNRFTVKAKGVKKLRLALAPGFVDFSRPIVVTAGGEVVFEGRVEPSLEAVVRSYLRDFDPATLAAAYLDVELP